jgi:hypothetical protein
MADASGQEHPTVPESLYNGLVVRTSDNLDVQWRGPSFALAAQSFLLLGFVESHDHWQQAIFSALIIVVGLVSIYVMHRLQLVIDLDRVLLDRYEEDLVHGHQSWLQHHQKPLRMRAREVLADAPDRIIREWDKILLADASQETREAWQRFLSDNPDVNAPLGQWRTVLIEGATQETRRWRRYLNGGSVLIREQLERRAIEAWRYLQIALSLAGAALCAWAIYSA